MTESKPSSKSSARSSSRAKPKQKSKTTPSKATPKTKQTAQARKRSQSAADLEAALRNLDEGLRSNVAGISDVITHSVLLTRDRIQEIIDDTVTRGRITRDDANDLMSNIVNRGRRQTDEVAKELEQLVTKFAQIEDAARDAFKRGGAGDTLLRTVEQARRAAGLGGAPPPQRFPIPNYEDLTARQIIDKLEDLTPAQLRKVQDYERRHANRKTVLNAIDKSLK